MTDKYLDREYNCYLITGKYNHPCFKKYLEHLDSLNIKGMKIFKINMPIWKNDILYGHSKDEIYIFYNKNVDTLYINNKQIFKKFSDVVESELESYQLRLTAWYFSRTLKLNVNLYIKSLVMDNERLVELIKEA